jgi:uncharacterized membrane protein YozB (DUF420 family)
MYLLFRKFSLSNGKRNDFLSRNKLLFPSLAIYAVYFLIYMYKDTYGLGYTVINNLDRIANVLWILTGIVAGLITIYLFWLKKDNAIDNKRVILYILFAWVMFLIFYPYAMALSLIEFAIFGWS